MWLSHSRMALWGVALGCSVGALSIGLSACGDDDEPRAPELEEALSRLRRAGDEVHRFSESARAAIENRESNAETRTKALRVFDGLAVGTRLPRERQEETVRSTLAHAASEANLTLGEVRIEVADRQARELPEDVPTEEGFRYAPDDLREVLEVRVEASPPRIERLEVFDRVLNGPDPQRFVVLTGIRATPRHFEIHAEAYRLLEVRPPRYVVTAPTLDEVLGSVGATEDRETFGENPEYAAALGDVRDALAEAGELAGRATVSLGPVTEADLLVAQTALLQRYAASVESRELADILR